MRRALSILPLLSLTLAAQQADEAELLALLNTPITVASKKALTTREAPGIVTLLRREEILASGARDLLELLRLVPGFEFGADVQGVVSVGVRGNWGHEGKVLLLWDGQEMNETRYATLQLGNHFPVDQIQQVEIIRGPGSAIYGGFAELAVINVITRGADTKGISASAGFSRDRQAGTRRSLSAAYGDRWGKVGFSAQLFTSRGLRSTSSYPDPNFGPVPLKDHGDMDPFMANLAFEVGDLSLRFLQDDYHMTDFTSFRDENPSQIRFDGRYAEAKYAWKIGDTFSLTPKLNWKDQAPWIYTDTRATSRRWVVRTTAELQAAWDPSDAVNLILGGSLSRDEGKSTPDRLYSNGKDTLTFKSSAFFAQALWKTSPLNITLGARFDKHDAFGSSFVPRLALTKVFGNQHFKFLASKAFRAPVIENLELNPTIKPEKTTALELEWGTQVSSQVFASFNVFDIQVKNPISYVYLDPGPGDFYENFDRSGTRGLEVDVQVRGGFGFLHSSLSYSQAVDNQVPFYAVPESSKYMVGLPNLKFTAGGSFRMGPTFTFNPTLVGLGPRYAYLPSATEPQRTPALAIVNLGLTWKPAEDVNLSFQVDNLLDSDITYIQAYGTLGATSGNNPPIPGARREVSLRFGYRL